MSEEQEILWITVEGNARADEMQEIVDSVNETALGDKYEVIATYDDIKTWTEEELELFLENLIEDTNND